MDLTARSVVPIFFRSLLLAAIPLAVRAAESPVQREIFLAPAEVNLGGLLGTAVNANGDGRLSHFIQDERSAPIALFNPDAVSKNEEGDWYGEHAGKWLVAASREANRTGNAVLAARVKRVADFLVSQQEPDGYLGTYAPDRRFFERKALGKRTWDIWIHSYLILGFLEVNHYFPDPKYVAAARRIGDLCLDVLTTRGFNITDLGNHLGISATVLLDPAVELYFATGDTKYLQLAKLVLAQANEKPGLLLLPTALQGGDVASIGDGKAYQLCWNFVGLAKLYRATGDAHYLTAVEKAWDNIRQYHLTLGGGPWGGVELFSRETFNSQLVFSPDGYVETCSIFSWMQLNRELLAITGESRYADEIEKSAYNDLLGAQDPNGEDWCYYSFPNGPRTNTTYWRCCKSSGALALEELSPVAYGTNAAGDVFVNLYGPNEGTITRGQSGSVGLRQKTDYPFGGAISIEVTPERVSRFVLSVRIPVWAEGAKVAVNGVPVAATPGTYLPIAREWRPGDKITLDFPMPVRLHKALNQSVQEAKLPDGTTMRQEVLHTEYAALTKGPLVYSTGLIDGYKTAETLRLPTGGIEEWTHDAAAPAGFSGPAVVMTLGNRAPLTFLPYYEADGRKDGAWRLTWMQTVSK
jgi:DUF1680 family protein